MRRTPVALGLGQVIREELAKAFAVFRYDTSRYTSVVQGTDGLSAADVERQNKVKEAYDKARVAPQESQSTATDDARIANSESSARTNEGQKQQQQQQHGQESSEEQATASPAPSFAERWEKVKNELMAVFGPKAGVAAIVDHCAKAHAAEVAVDLDIDVKSVQVQSERSAVGEGSHVVGYIDAPAATQEEVHVFAQRLTKACPAARTFGDVVWRHGPSPRR